MPRAGKTRNSGSASAPQQYRKRTRNMGQSQGTASDDNGAVPWGSLPVSLQEEVLLRVPAQDVVLSCSRVCKLWWQLADSTSLWKRRCAQEGLRPCDPQCPPANWKIFYFLCMKMHNLLKNPCAEDKFNGWHLQHNGGDKWNIEDVSPHHALPDLSVQKFFVTSYGQCLKSQLIDLVKKGYPPSLLDEVQPDIVVSDWYAPRWDCGCQYEICVQLLSHRKKVLQEFRPKMVIFPQWNDMQWNQVRHVFQKYGRGVRFVRFCHGGKDTQFWAGWYGIRVTNSSVEIDPGLDRD